MRGFSGLYKKILILFIIVGCSSLESVHKTQDKDFADQVPDILNKFLDASRPNRAAGTPGHEKAFDFIKGQFDEIATAAKGRVIIHEFVPNSGKFRNLPGKNIILEISGRKDPEKVIYFGAHYDTGLGAPNESDNSGGIAALLVMSRELRFEHPDVTLRFVAFDFEETGSVALAQDINAMRPRWLRPGEQTMGLFNLELKGSIPSPLDKYPVVKLYTRTKESPGAQQDGELAKAFMRATFISKSPLKIVLLQNGFTQSDHGPFWQKSFPAICISEGLMNNLKLVRPIKFDYLKELTKDLVELGSEVSKNDALWGI